LRETERQRNILVSSILKFGNISGNLKSVTIKLSLLACS